MHHIESDCPVCGKNTSGTLPVVIYHRKGKLALTMKHVYPCADHLDTVCNEQWQEEYFDVHRYNA